MTRFDALILAIPGIITLGLIVAGQVLLIRRERAAYRLFANETGLTKTEWDELPPRRQKEWIQRHIEDREITRFIDDFNKRRGT